jgi:hypothetical protein
MLNMEEAEKIEKIDYAQKINSSLWAPTAFSLL